MASKGEILSGSVASAIVAIVAAAPRPLARAEINRSLQPRQRLGLPPALDRLLDNGVLIAVPGGFMLPGQGHPPEPQLAPDRVATPQPLAEPLRRHLDAIQRRAHALTRSGQRASAVLLLDTASRHPAMPAHVGAGLASLAALFRHHDPEGAAA